jgi:hypothetical protein
MLGAAVLIGAQASTATAQWTVVNLHPAGATGSRAYGVDGGVQAGEAWVDGWPRACLWHGSAETWVNLDPAGSSQSRAYGVCGGAQVGVAYVPVYWHAALWSGSPDTWVNLNPVGVTYSMAYGVDGGQQVGYWISYDMQSRACLWSGSAASWVNLDPYGSLWSVAKGAGGGQQVGRARVNNATRASLWTGTAASWVDLHPAGVTSSFALDAHDGQQVGYVDILGHHASLWTGTSASWVDLRPAGALESEALAVNAGEQVGWATFAAGVRKRASLWNGTSASWTDLHAFLPPEFNESEACGISHNASFTDVAGWGWNTTTGREEALLWTKPSPAVAVEDPRRHSAMPRLSPGWPNPFNPATTIAFSLPQTERVRLVIFDLTGRLVRVIVDEVRAAGSYEVQWNGTGARGQQMASGVYVCRMEAGSLRETQRMTLVR